MTQQHDDQHPSASENSNHGESVHHESRPRHQRHRRKPVSIERAPGTSAKDGEGSTEVPAPRVQSDQQALDEVSKLLKEVFSAHLTANKTGTPNSNFGKTSAVNMIFPGLEETALEKTVVETPIPAADPSKLIEPTPLPARVTVEKPDPIPAPTPSLTVEQPVQKPPRPKKPRESSFQPTHSPVLPATEAPQPKPAPVSPDPVTTAPVTQPPAAEDVRPVKRPLRILMVAAELAPYVKSGGLADMVASLSARMKTLGHDVRVVIPRYSMIDGARYPMKQCHGPMGVWMGSTQQWCLVLESSGDGGVPVYLVEFKEYYERWGIYHAANMDDYKDNPARFGFLCRAALQFCSDTGWAPDIVHAHDWHTAMAPAYVKSWHWNDPVVGPAASVLTIHNLSYQGKYPRSFQTYLGIAPGHYNPSRFEDGGMINLLKGGLSFSDMITTVSPTHRDEICTPQGGFGLAPFLTSMGNRLRGILNGVDYAAWSPENDALIPEKFSVGDLSGKRACKRAMQETFGLGVDDHIAVVGAIGRFVDQKGFHLIASIIDNVLRNMHVQFVILGSGKKDLEGFFFNLPGRFPGKAGSYIGYSDRHAHLIEAGCDFFLMPSLFEPCGLNQMYSQRYGTLPIVRTTGGLNDTVDNYDQNTGSGTGFKFLDPTPRALLGTLGWVMATYYDRPHHMEMLRRSAMQRDYSWERSAQQYLDVYAQAMANKKAYDAGFSGK